MGFSAADKRWQRYNQKLQKLMKANDFFGLGTTYYEMADFIVKEGSDPTIYREQGYKMKLKVSERTLKTWIESGIVSFVEILGAPDSCELCMKLGSKKLGINEALNNSPIPAENCIHKYGCRCTYLPQIIGEK